MSDEHEKRIWTVKATGAAVGSYNPATGEITERRDLPTVLSRWQRIRNWLRVTSGFGKN